MINSKLVTIESSGKIGVLGGLIGPITTPCRLRIDVLISLINTGKVVYEVNPANVKEKIRLTRLNVRKENFSNNAARNVGQSGPKGAPGKPGVPLNSKTKIDIDTDNSKFNISVNDNKDIEITAKPKETNEKKVSTDTFVSNKKS